MSKEKELISHVQTSIELAEHEFSKLLLDDLTLKIAGMSSMKVRHLLNNLCARKETVYFEVGLWRGSTFISALFENENNVLEAVGVDNWSKFGGPYEDFLFQCSLFLSRHHNRKVYSEHSFSLKKNEAFERPVNVYFYDGEHTKEAQEMAFTYFNDVLDDHFIAIIDDWNWPQVREGTYSAFKKLDYQILFERSLPAKSGGDMENWYNGIYTALIAKP